MRSGLKTADGFISNLQLRNPIIIPELRGAILYKIGKLSAGVEMFEGLSCGELRSALSAFR